MRSSRRLVGEFFGEAPITKNPKLIRVWNDPSMGPSFEHHVIIEIETPGVAESTTARISLLPGDAVSIGQMLQQNG